MPVNDRYPLADVLAECRRYVELRDRKVFVEYVMLAGVNDSPRAGARARRGCSAGDAFKVNLIPYNPTGRYDGSSRDAIAAFKRDARPRARSRRRCGSRAAATSPPPAGSSPPSATPRTPRVAPGLELLAVRWWAAFDAERAGSGHSACPS